MQLFSRITSMGNHSILLRLTGHIRLPEVPTTNKRRDTHLTSLEDNHTIARLEYLQQLLLRLIQIERTQPLTLLVHNRQPRDELFRIF